MLWMPIKGRKAYIVKYIISTRNDTDINHIRKILFYVILIDITSLESKNFINIEEIRSTCILDQEQGPPSLKTSWLIQNVIRSKLIDLEYNDNFHYPILLRSASRLSRWC